MYSDVQELHDGQAACLEQDLRRAADGAARSAATSGSNNAPRGTTQRQGSSSSSSNTSAMSGSTLAPPPVPNSPPVASGISPANPGAPLPVTSRFVLLCINGPRFPQLRQVPLASQQASIAAHDNDRILFDNIRRAYIEVRRSYRPSFHPETPTVIKIFVGWMHRAWKASQKLTAELFKLLRIQWLVWWVGDDVFFVPKSANFVKVGSSYLRYFFFFCRCFCPPISAFCLLFSLLLLTSICSLKLSRSRRITSQRFWNPHACPRRRKCSTRKTTTTPLVHSRCGTHFCESRGCMNYLSQGYIRVISGRNALQRNSCRCSTTQVQTQSSAGACTLWKDQTGTLSPY